MFFIEKIYLSIAERKSLIKQKQIKKRTNKKNKKEFKKINNPNASIDEIYERTSNVEDNIDTAQTELKYSRFEYGFYKFIHTILNIITIIFLAKPLMYIYAFVGFILLILGVLLIIDILPALICFIVGLVQMNTPIIIYGSIGIPIGVLSTYILKKIFFY